MVLSSIDIEDIEQEVFNYGDTINVKGIIYVEDGITGIMKYILRCGDVKTILETERVGMNNQYNFSKELLIPNIKGECRISIDFYSDGEVVESADSNVFSISDSLNSIFNIDYDEVQLGQKNELNAYVTYLNDKQLSGMYELTIKVDGEEFMKKTGKIVDAQFKYGIDAVLPGEYYVDINIKDIFGNEQFYSEEIKFKVSDKIDIRTDSFVGEALPGETIIVSGEVFSDIDYAFEGLKGFIWFNDKEYELKFEGNKFSASIEITENVKSGDNNLDINIEDKIGNKGVEELLIDVKAIITEIKVELDKDSFMPEEKIKFTVNLVDQADDVVDEKVFVYFAKINKSVVSGEESYIVVPENTEPGEQIIKAEYEEFSDEKKISILEKEGIIVDVNGDLVRVRNIGNVRYKKAITFNLERDGKEVVFEKKVDLEPGEEKEISLAKELPTGNYEVEIFVPEQQPMSHNVNVEDQRPVMKKAFDGISSVTGMSTGILATDKDKMYGVIMVLVFLVLIGIVGFNLIYHQKLVTVMKKVGKELKFHKKLGEKHVDINKQLKESIKDAYKEKNETQKLFNKYVDPKLVKMATAPENKGLVGQEKEISILFVDIRGFTGMSEEMDNEEVIRYLNLYFKYVTKSVYKYGGVVAQLIGDAVVAFFNAHQEDKDHALNAVKCALDMLAEVKVMNDLLTRNKKKPLDIGIGINSGKVILGNIGTDRIMEYTAIGDSVNLASRLVDKADVRQILVSKSTYDDVRENVKAEHLGLVMFKNKSIPVNVYNVESLVRRVE